MPGRRLDPARAEQAIRDLLEALGLDPADPALAATPRTASRAFADVLLAGHHQDPLAAIGRGFPVKTLEDSPVVAAHIPLMFVCPHHLMPAHGEAHVAFLPRARVPGLARIARLVDVLAHRLVLQEELTAQIVRALHDALDVRAAVAVLEASHTCVAVEDYARRDTKFRTRAALGSKADVRSLEREIASVLLARREPRSSPRGPSRRGGPPRSKRARR